MLKIRISYTDKKEFDEALNNIKNNFNVIKVTAPYRNKNHDSYMVYIETDGMVKK